MAGLFRKPKGVYQVTKYLVLLCIALTGSAFAAGTWGTWDSVPMPPTITPAYKIRDCESDSKGNLYYTATLNNLHSQSPDGKTYTEYPGVPDPDSSGNMGLYIDQSTDSVYVGTVRGTIQVGKNGVFHKMTPVPLTVMESQYTSTRIHDIYRDKSGYLTALTDSLAWWFNGTEWSIIGQKSDYDVRAIQNLEVGAYLPNGDYVANVNIIHANRTVSPLLVFGEGLSVGPTGTIYGGGGGGSQRLYYSLPPYNRVDTLETTQQGESPLAKSLRATFEDKDGWLWIPQEGRMLFLKNMVIQKILPMPSITMANQVPLKMLLTPDSTFWMCASSNIYRYSKKYSVPQEVLDAVNIRSTPNITQNGLRIQVEGALLLLEARKGETWRVQILNLQGKRAWSSQVLGDSQIIPLQSGRWIIQATNSNGQSLRQTISIIP